MALRCSLAVRGRFLGRRLRAPVSRLCTKSQRGEKPPLLIEPKHEGDVVEIIGKLAVVQMNAGFHCAPFSMLFGVLGE